MIKRILLNITTISILSFMILILTGCEDVVSQVPFVSKEEVPEVLVSDYNVVFMFSQVNRGDLTVLDVIDSLRDEYGFKTDTIILNDDSKITSSLRTALENGADLVVGYGQGMAIVFDLFQDTYPDAKFVVIDGQAQDEDIKSINFDTDAISYALGVTMATAFTGNNDFGYIGDFENDNNMNYKVGYIKGLQSINKNASIDIDYVNSAVDRQAAYDLTVYYQSLGVKFVMNATNPTVSEGIYQACLDLASEGKYIYTNAFSNDRTSENNPYILSGIIKDYDYVTNLVVNDLIQEKFNTNDIEVTAQGDSFHLLDITTETVNFTNKDILNENSIKAGRKALDDIKNKNIVL